MIVWFCAIHTRLKHWTCCMRKSSKAAAVLFCTHPVLLENSLMTFTRMGAAEQRQEHQEP